MRRFEDEHLDKEHCRRTSAVLPLLEGCTRHSKSEHYYLVTVNVDLPYWKTAAEGFQKAAAEYGVTAEMRGPTSSTRRPRYRSFARRSR